MSAVQTLEDTRARVGPQAPQDYRVRGLLRATCYEFRRIEGGLSYSAVLVVRAHISNKHLDKYPGLAPSETEQYEYRVRVGSMDKRELDKRIQEVILGSLTPENKSWIPVAAPIGITTRGLEREGYFLAEQDPTSVDVRWPNKVAS